MNPDLCVTRTSYAHRVGIARKHDEEKRITREFKVYLHGKIRVLYVKTRMKINVQRIFCESLTFWLDFNEKYVFLRV